MKVYFKEQKHQYFNELHEPYISVSALAKKLEPKKDWNAILKKKAKKDGVDPKELKAIWDNKTLLGSQAGTKVHRKSEQHRLNSPQAIINNVECSIVPCSFSEGLKWSEDSLKLEPNRIYPEKMIYSHIHRVCGQSDEVRTPKSIIEVFDIKTDKEIARKAYSSEWVQPEKLLSPVSHLDNCNFNMYSIKMSLYMYMLWLENKHMKTGDLLLQWQPILRDENGIPILDDQQEPTILKSEIIEVPYLRKEARDILQWYKEGKL